VKDSASLAAAAADMMLLRNRISERWVVRDRNWMVSLFILQGMSESSESADSGSARRKLDVFSDGLHMHAVLCDHFIVPQTRLGWGSGVPKGPNFKFKRIINLTVTHTHRLIYFAQQTITAAIVEQYEQCENPSLTRRGLIGNMNPNTETRLTSP
jgi:hypothetical protein